MHSYKFWRRAFELNLYDYLDVPYSDYLKEKEEILEYLENDIQNEIINNNTEKDIIKQLEKKVIQLKTYKDIKLIKYLYK